MIEVCVFHYHLLRSSVFFQKDALRVPKRCEKDFSRRSLSLHLDRGMLVGQFPQHRRLFRLRREMMDPFFIACDDTIEQTLPFGVIQAPKLDSGCHAILLVFVSQKFGDPVCTNFRETQFIVKNFTNGGLWDRSKSLLCQIAPDLTCRSPSIFFNETTYRVHGVFCNHTQSARSQFFADVSTTFQKLAMPSTVHLNWQYVAIHFNNVLMDSARIFSFCRVVVDNRTHFKLGRNGQQSIPCSCILAKQIRYVPFNLQIPLHVVAARSVAYSLRNKNWNLFSYQPSYFWKLFSEIFRNSFRKCLKYFSKILKWLSKFSAVILRIFWNIFQNVMK